MWRGIGLISIHQFLGTLLIHCHGGKGKGNENSQLGEERGEWRIEGSTSRMIIRQRGLTRAKQYPQGFIEKNNRIAKR
jgi:hypothetical protein